MRGMDVRDLMTRGYAEVEYPSGLRERTAEAMAAWKEFCALPEEQKARFPYTPDMKASGNGYELKKGTAYDFKENFHLRVSAREWLMEHALLVDPVVTPRFIEAALALNEAQAELLREFSRGVEREFGVAGFESDVMLAQEDWLLRFLHYFGDQEPGAPIAAPHSDKGPFTLHLAETAPGVQGLERDRRTWSDLALVPGKTIIFPGMGLQHRSRCAVKALCHRVVATEESAREGRYAAVSFITPLNTRFFDKKRLGSQQAFEPGAFYDTPFSEFDRYFTD